MPQKPKARPLSASRQRRQNNRRSSLTLEQRPSEIVLNPQELPLELTVPHYGVDIRPTKEKIESLEAEIKHRKDDFTFEEHLNCLVLIQLYTSLEYGTQSLENAKAYVDLSKFYLGQKNYIVQAKDHILKAQYIIEQLNITPDDEHITRILLAFEIYFILVKCSFQAKDYSFQRDNRKKQSKAIHSNNTKNIDDDLSLLEQYLEKMQHLTDSNSYNEKYFDHLLMKFEIIIHNSKEFNRHIKNLIKTIIELIDQSPSTDKAKQKIDIFLRSAYYFVNFDDEINEGLNFHKLAVELAEEQENKEPSDIHKRQLANASYQWGRTKVKIGRLADSTQRKLKRAIDLYKQVTDENDKDILKVYDELAAYYTKVENYQDALGVLCQTLPDKKRLYDDFSEEVIQAQSRIGAIYLREGEYVNAAEYLKECLELQEFVYGPKDPKTCQTRDAVEILKKDPRVSQVFFSRTQEGIRQDRPAFSLSNKVSYDKEDRDLLSTVTKKPPIHSKY